MRCSSWPIVMVLLAASCAPVRMANVKLTPPFHLTPDEEKNVNHLLARWEQWNAGVKTFDCRFKRWTYDPVFGRPDEPKFVDFGEIKYAAPDRTLYRVDKTEKDGKEVPIEDSRAEHLIFDSTSLILWDHATLKITEWKRAPTADGPKTLGGPLTLMLGPSMVMGGEAKTLKDHYYFREITSRDTPRGQIWLEAYPRTGLAPACITIFSSSYWRRTCRHLR